MITATRPGHVRERVYASTTDTYNAALDLDYVAIEHALNGEPVTLNLAEKVHVARILDAQGRGTRFIAPRVGAARETVADWKANGWQASPPAGSKLTDGRVRDIRARAAAGEYHHLIAEDMGVSRVTVTRVVNRQAWAHVA